MSIQTKLLIVLGIFFAGSVAGGWGVHKLYQAAMKAEPERRNVDNNAKMRVKHEAYTETATEEQQVGIRKQDNKSNINQKMCEGSSCV